MLYYYLFCSQGVCYLSWFSGMWNKLQLQLHGYECFGGAFWVYLHRFVKNGGSMPWPRPRYPPVRLHGPLNQKTVILNLNTLHFPWWIQMNIPCDLTLILLTWRIWWAPNNVSRWQMGFNSAFKGLTLYFGQCTIIRYTRIYCLIHVFSWFVINVVVYLVGL
jgi:hypothetical protein